MRQTQASSNGDFSARAIAGTHTVLIALNCKDPRRKDLKGFAFQREVVGPGGTGPKWLRSLKVFKSAVPDPLNAKDPADPTKRARFYTNDFPIQSFLWGDYGSQPGTQYRFRIQPMYGKPGALTTDAKDEIDIAITTEAGMARGLDPRRVVQPRRHRQPEVRRGIRQQGAAGHQRPGGSGSPMAVARTARSLPGIHQRDQAGRCAAGRRL